MLPLRALTRVALVPEFLLGSRYMRYSGLSNKCATNLKIMVQLSCLRESHIPNKGISHVGSSGRIRAKVIMEIELRTVVLQ